VLLVMVTQFSHSQPPEEGKNEKESSTYAVLPSSVSRESLARQLDDFLDKKTKINEEVTELTTYISSTKQSLETVQNAKSSIDFDKEFEELSKIEIDKNRAKVIEKLSSIRREFLEAFRDNLPFRRDNSFSFLRIVENSENDLSSKARDFFIINIDIFDRNTWSSISESEVREAIQNFKSKYSNSQFEKYKGIRLTNKKELLDELQKERDRLLNEAKQLEINIEELYKRLEEKEININSLAIYWGLPAFCITVIVLFVITFLYRNNSIKDQQNDQVISKVLLEIITVLLLTLTVLILGLSRILSENVLGTLIGGIAGYILNRTKTT
jgi:hypothetical protein